MKNSILVLTLILVGLTAFGCATQYENDDKNDTNKMHDDMQQQMNEHMEDMDEMMNGDVMGHDMMGMNIKDDENFLVMMIPHHQEAIDTAKIILGKSENVELKDLADAIIKAQTGEIDQMQKWGTEWYGTSFKPSKEYMNMMPSNLNELEGKELDQAFITGMIMHHQGAIMMAKQIKEKTERPELLEMADNIIEAQAKEIEMMQGWQ